MKQIWLALPMSLVLAAPAQAVRPSYSYLDAAYLKTEVDGSADGAEGVRVSLNASLTRWFYFTGDYDRRNVDNEDLDLSDTSLGFGLHSLKSTFQLFAEGTYERTDADGHDTDASMTPIDETDEGYGLQLGARLPIGFGELQADYKYFKFGDFPDGSRNDEDRYRLSALAHLTPTFALTGSYEIFEQAKDVDQWTVGLRVYFKNRHDMSRKKRVSPAAPAAPDLAATPSANQEAEAQ